MRLGARTVLVLLVMIAFFSMAAAVFAGSPSGNNYFQLLLSAGMNTGGDRTGDGGTGNPADLNYFYVGQTFTTNIQVSSTHTNSANIWLDYSTTTFSAGSLTTGSYFPTWSNQTISGGRIKSTGFRVSGYSSGVGDFGAMQFTVLRPTQANYGTAAAATLLINVGMIGETTESNISYLGADILDDKEDFLVNTWADTKAPYATNPNPANSGTGFNVAGNYTFDLRDSKNGDGDNSGFGTGVNTLMGSGGGQITINSVSYSSSDVFFTASSTSSRCNFSGNNCGYTLYNTSINPNPPSGIAGDQRNWNYNATYTVAISGFLDKASAVQDQLGDTNGPNPSALKTYTFSTEADTVKPQVTSVTPAGGATTVSPSTNITIDVLDKKTYPGSISGTGVSSTSCRITVNSATFTSTTFQQGSVGVTITAIDYGYRYDIDPSTDFGQNETVFVNVHDCQDLADTPNVMIAYPFSFSTADLETPYVDGQNPANDASINVGDNIIFNIKDNGTVDLAHTILYINGVYYTNSGGAGAVTTNGTRITFASSLNFNGGTGTGANTAVSAISGGYNFIIDPVADFTAGEAIPIVIYTQDISGNLMERLVYSAVVNGSSCPGGSSYCGSNTTWDAGLGKCTSPNGSSYCGSNATWDAGLAKCVGTGGESGSGSAYCGSNTTWDAGLGRCVGNGGGSGGVSIIVPTINPANVTALQIDETSILLTWYSSQAGSSRVIYDTQSPKNYGTSPNYNYAYSTSVKNDNSAYHSVVVDGLHPGVIYYLRPITIVAGNEIRGEEITMVTKSSQPDCNTCPIKQVQVCPNKPAVPTKTPGISTPVRETQINTPLSNILKILNISIVNIKNTGNSIMINGTASPLSNLILTIY